MTTHQMLFLLVDLVLVVVLARLVIGEATPNPRALVRLLGATGMA